MSEHPYKTLLNKLHEFEWPNDYMFKFIIPNDGEKRNQVKNIFEQKKPKKYQTKLSKNKNYESFTIVVKMLNPDKVIEIYQEAEKIKGLISL